MLRLCCGLALFILSVVSHRSEVATLRRFAERTGVEHWADACGWSDLAENNTDPCCYLNENCASRGLTSTWIGVSCSCGCLGGDCYVTSIVLPVNDLKGRLGDELNNLTHLNDALVLSDNFLSGAVPSGLSVKWLDVSNNDLGGNLDFVCDSPLTVLDVRENRVSGTVPDCFDDMVAMDRLAIGRNRITGTLPPLLTVTTLIASLNSISGTLPESLSTSSNVQLANNMLSGTLPNFSDPLTEVISLAHNYLSGTIPSMSLPNLRTLSLEHNRLSGTIPNIFGTGPLATDPEVITLGGNQLVAPIPPLIPMSIALFGVCGQKNRLQMLDLSQNPLGLKMHTIMEQIVSFDDGSDQECAAFASKLRSLDLSSTNMSGFDPNILTYFSLSLEFLHLHDNTLQAALPRVPLPWLLVVFDGRNADIIGPLPSTFETFSLSSVALTVDLRGNSELIVARGGGQNAAPGIPAYLSIYNDTHTDNSTGHYSCPKLAGLGGKPVFQLDPSAYGHSSCRCQENYYGMLGECRLVSDLCPAEEEGCALSSGGLVRVRPGFYPLPNPYDVKALYRCPGTADGTSCNPHGSARCFARSVANGTFVTECEMVCLEGSSNRLCSECGRGYYMEKQVCKVCPTISTTTMIITLSLPWVVVLVFVLGMNAVFVTIIQCVLVVMLAVADGVHVFVVAFALLLTTVLAGVFSTPSQEETQARGLFKIFIIYAQTLHVLLSSVGAPWPVSVNAVTDVAGAFNLQANGLSCINEDLFTFVGQFLLYMMMPIGVAFTAALVLVLSRAAVVCRSSWKNRWDDGLARQTAARAVFFAWYLFYFILVKTCLGAFSCFSTDFEDVNYLSDLPYIPCTTDNPEWLLVAIVAACCLLLYAVIVPVWASVRVYKGREQLQQNPLKRVLGFLFESYRPEMWWFEIVVSTRRLVIAVVIALSDARSPLTSPLLIAVLVVSLILQQALQPFLHATANYLEATSLAALLFSYTSSLVYFSVVVATGPTSLRDLLDIVGNSIAATNVLLTLAFAVVIFLLYLPRVRNVLATCTRGAKAEDTIALLDSHPPEREREKDDDSIACHAPERESEQVRERSP